MKRLAFLLLLTLLALFGVQTSARTEGPPGLLARVAAYDGLTNAFVRQGDILYAGNGVKVAVYDVGDPAHPRHLADSPLMPEVVSDVAVSGHWLLAADDIGGLWIFHIQPDHQLQFARHLFTSAIVSHVRTQGDRAYVTGWGQARGFLAVLSLGDDGVTLAGQTEVNPIKVMDVVQGVVYAAGQGSLDIYDATNPEQIRALGHYNQPEMDEFTGIQVIDHTAYISGLSTDFGTNLAWLITVDVSDPAAPQKLALWPFSQMVTSLSVQQSLLYAGGASVVLICDISDPVHPRQVGSYEAGALALLAAADQLISSNGLGDILISDISAPTSPQPAGRIARIGRIQRMKVETGRLFVVGGHGDFKIYDATDPAHLRLLGVESGDQGRMIEDFVVSDDVVYQTFYRYDFVAQRSDYALRVLDISDPAQPRQLARYPLTIMPHRLAYANGYLYLSDDIHLLVFDVSRPAQPDLLSFSLVHHTFADMIAGADMIYATEKHIGLAAWNVADPYLPHSTAMMYTPGRSAWELDRHQDEIIVADGRGGFAFIDISQPQNPRLKSALTCDMVAQNLAVADDMLFAVCHDLNRQQRLHAYDISAPDHPQAMATTFLSRHEYNTYDPPFHALAAQDDAIFFNAGDGGLQVFRYFPPARTRHLWLPTVHLPASSPFLSPAPIPPTPTFAPAPPPTPAGPPSLP